MPRVGVLGSLVWDEIHGRDPRAASVEEWGGIAYALAGLDAALARRLGDRPAHQGGPRPGRRGAGLPADTQPRRARERAASRCRRQQPGRPATTRSAERRCERMAGGVPAWNWPELGPMVPDLDALYVNFLSGFEMCLGTAAGAATGVSRSDLRRPPFSLLLGVHGDGMRMLQAPARRAELVRLLRSGPGQ